MYPPSDHTATQGQRATQTPRRTKGRVGGSGGAQSGGQELGVRRKGVVQLGAERGAQTRWAWWRDGGRSRDEAEGAKSRGLGTNP